MMIPTTLTRTAVGVALLLALPVSARAEAYDGLTLINTMNSSTMRLVTNDFPQEPPVNTWNCGRAVAYMPYLMPDSTVWRPGRHPSPFLRPPAYGGRIERFNWDGDVIQSFDWSGPNHIQHHDIEPLPNGNVLVLSLDRYTRAEAQARGRVNISSSHIWSEMIVEYDPVADSVVWEWRFWDRLVQDVDPDKPGYGVISEHPHRLDINAGLVRPNGDWIHANAVDYWEEEELIAVSSHYLNEIYIIDRSTTTEEARGSTGGRHGKGGDFLYRWGNPQLYGRGTVADQRLFVVHGVNFIRPGLPGEGNVLLLNNGDRPGSSNDYSSAEELVLPRDSLGRFILHPDSAFGPEEPVWMYSNPGVFYSNHLGGAFRLPNGNTLITEGTRSRVFEVTSDGRVVCSLNLEAQTGRVQKYPRDFATGARESAARPAPAPFAALPTIIRGRLFLSAGHPGLGHNPDSGDGIGLCPAPTVLLDAIGRKVMDLAPGENDVRHLPPGVYFVRAHARPVARVLLVD